MTSSSIVYKLNKFLHSFHIIHFPFAEINADENIHATIGKLHFYFKYINQK